MGLKRAFELLISELYGSFILTVGCIAVGKSHWADMVMTILRCLTRMLEIFMVKVTLKVHEHYYIYRLQTT